MRHVILNCHGIGTPGRLLEPGEAPYWVTPDLFETALSLADRLSDRVRTSFTFDDGNLSDLAIGAGGLGRYGRQATFFVLSDRIGQAGSLGEDDIRALVKQGHAIGSHGAAHVDWTGLDDAGRTREFDAARAIVAEAAGRPVTAAAIPFGRYDAGVLRALRHRRYAEVYSSDGGSAGNTPIARTSVRADMGEADLEAILLGREPVARRIRRRVARLKKRWI